MKCFWTRAADDDRHAIWYYNMDYGLEEAIRVDRLIEQAVEIITRTPHSGLTGRSAGTYELTPEPTFRLIYEIRTQGAVILAVMHAAFALTDIEDPRPPVEW